ncbi:MAG: hypothetical protein KF746_27190 [Chitinophagaceae bacterium]|nr:hypothetical protein [Chitinophagaceae bacterium]
MKSIIFILSIVLMVFAGCVNKSEMQKEVDLDEKINKLVLSENKIGEEYFFKAPTSKGILEYEVTYLGSISTSKGDSLKFLNNVVFTGLYEDSKRASCTVNIYDTNNKKIGYYYVGGLIDAPQRVEGANLVFSYNNGRCNQTTAVNFKDSIPHQIFVSCTKEGGDVYTFSKE